MTDQQRDALLERLERGQADLRDTLRDHGERLNRIEAKVDAVDDRVSDLARALRELGGHVGEPQAEATG